MRTNLPSGRYSSLQSFPEFNSFVQHESVLAFHRDVVIRPPSSSLMNESGKEVDELLHDLLLFQMLPTKNGHFAPECLVLSLHLDQLRVDFLLFALQCDNT